jgi:excinuclease ABC subunit B
MGIATWHEVKPDRAKHAGPRKPTLDEMGPGTESKIYQPKSMTESMPNAPPPRSRSAERGGASSSPGSGSKIIQPTNSRESGPEFGPAPRSSGGAPGHRGGWKKR